MTNGKFTVSIIDRMKHSPMVMWDPMPGRPIHIESPGIREVFICGITSIMVVRIITPADQEMVFTGITDRMKHNPMVMWGPLKNSRSLEKPMMNTARDLFHYFLKYPFLIK